MGDIYIYINMEIVDVTMWNVFWGQGIKAMDSMRTTSGLPAQPPSELPAGSFIPEAPSEKGAENGIPITVNQPMLPKMVAGLLCVKHRWPFTNLCFALEIIEAHYSISIRLEEAIPIVEAMQSEPWTPESPGLSTLPEEPGDGLRHLSLGHRRHPNFFGSNNSGDLKVLKEQQVLDPRHLQGFLGRSTQLKIGCSAMDIWEVQSFVFRSELLV